MSNKKKKSTKIKKKISKKKVLKEALKQIIDDVCNYLPYSVVYSIHESDEETNNDHGWISVGYVPTQREISFSIYKSFYRDYDYPLPKKQKSSIYKAICHEIGHCMIEELVELAKHRFLNPDELERVDEKIATDVGDLIFKVWMDKR